MVSDFLLKIYFRLAHLCRQVAEWHDATLLKRVLLRGLISVGHETYGLKWNTVDGASLNSPVKIGNYCSFAPGVKILADVNHPTDLPSTYPFKSRWGVQTDRGRGSFNADTVTRGPIEIGSDVWVGESAMILSGVTIGDGCIVGAGAVVTRNLPPYSVAVGNPCRIVRTRFAEPLASRLLASRWWTLTRTELLPHLGTLYSTNIDLFLAAIDEHRANALIVRHE